MTKKKQIPQAKRTISPEKTKEKSKKPIIKIPDTDLRPTPGNILCIGILLTPQKQGSNLILPTKSIYDKRRAGGDADIKEKEHKRYFVVSSAAQNYSLAPGDEIFIADNPQAIGYTAPVIFDQETGFQYIKFDEMEISTFRKKANIDTVDIEFLQLQKFNMIVS
jgi:hypothetical protein